MSAITVAPIAPTFAAIRVGLDATERRIAALEATNTDHQSTIRKLIDQIAERDATIAELQAMVNRAYTESA